MASGASTSARLWTRVLRRQLPTSLWGRALLIIVLPIALMQVAVTWAFFEAHWETVTARLSEGLAGDVAWAVDSYLDEPTPEHLVEITDQAQIMQLSVALREGGTLPTRDRPAFFVALDRSLDNALSDRLDPQPFWFDTTRYPNHVEIQVQVEAGVLRFIAPRERAFATRGHIFILWLGGATILLTAIAIVFIRNQVRAIERLADAAEAFGKGEEDVAFKPHGAREVRRAATAFLSMRERIQRYIDQRTILLASVSHDLRTPLTRLRFRIENAPEEHRAKMAADIDQMEEMISAALAFVRDASRPGERTPLELSSLLESLCDEMAETGADTEVESGDKVVLHGDPIALRRLFTNLLENAVKFGGRARARIFRQDSSAVVEIEDDGPGIPAEDADKVFEPFFRREPSRSRQTGGIGLGLAVVRSIARGHGGDVALTNRMGGGLTARVQLPL